MDQPILSAVAPIKAAMQKTASQPIAATESTDLIFQRHVGGEGAVVMVLNTHQELPKIADNEKYWIWNYAPYQATFKLEDVEPGSAVYAVEGIDWKKVSKVADPSKPIQADFAAGEMKLYLVAPREPKGLQASARAVGSAIEASAGLSGLQMPWPITVSVMGPDGKPLYRVSRTLGTEGKYAEAFPIGANAKPGSYAVEVASPVASLAAAAKVQFASQAGPLAPLRDAVRVLDEQAVVAFLAAKPALAIAIGSDTQRTVADRLAQSLRAKGITAQVVEEKTILRRARYPRVWDPYFKLYRNEGEERVPEGKIDFEVRVETLDDGPDLGHEWRTRRNVLATVAGQGYIDYHAADGEEGFEPGCKIHVNQQGQRLVLKGVRTEVQADDDVRRTWSRPWHRLSSYQGTFNLIPQLPEAYQVDAHLVLLGDSTSGELVRALQASELLPQVVDAKYPGPGKSLISLAWSPFALERNAILVGAADDAGLQAGAAKLAELAESSSSLHVP
jgi:hypothetical protein